MKLSKAGRGIAFGDVSNSAVRNILSEISKFEQFTKVTPDEMEKAEDFFEWECPYTGRRITNHDNPAEDGFVLDHIVPQNRTECGLNVMGNLIFVDKQANRDKHSKSYQEYIREIEPNANIAQARIDKIKDFQKKYNYDPVWIRERIGGILEDHYQQIQEEQKFMIEDIKGLI